MARAPHPGAPQRVSAHVVPKAATLLAGGEDEKTTVESSGWEDEASTTVEQGEVADRLRALGVGAEPPRRTNTSITSTDGSGVSDEPTVDDQRANAALAMLPPPSVARLVVTGGNDSGRSLEIRPGKTYTIGRGIDNDLVLTDITASRKHFDIRHENGSWILADRGSGNGTLVNHRIEDAPFMLAGGDTIEVGNTAFRFEVVHAVLSAPSAPREAPGASDAQAPANGLSGAGRDGPDSRDRMAPGAHERAVSRELAAPAMPHGDPAPALVRAGPAARGLTDAVPREAPNVPTYDGSVDDELEPPTVSGKPLPEADLLRPQAVASRPKTLPPPAPLPRPRTQTGRPPLGFAHDRAVLPSQSMAVPPPPPAGPAGVLGPAMPPTLSPLHAPALLPQPATTLPLPQMANRPPISPGLRDPSLGPLPATLPGQGPPVPVRAPRLPFSYPSVTGMVPQHAPSQVRGPVHLPSGHATRDATSTAQVLPISYSGSQAAIEPHGRRGGPRLSHRLRIALGGTGLVVLAALAALIVIRSASGGAGALEGPGPDPATPPGAPGRDPVVAPEGTSPPTVTPIRSALAAASGATSQPRAGEAGGSPSPVAAPPPTSGADKIASAAAPVRPAPEAPSAAAPSGASSDPGAPARTARIAAVAATAPTGTSPSADHAASPERHETATPAPRDDNRGDKKHAGRSIETRKADRKAAEVAAPAAPVPRGDKKHAGRSMQEVKAEATARYRSRDFSGAAALLTASLSGFSGDDVKELKSLAAIYAQLGKAYHVGMAPGTKPTEAYVALRRALDYDREVGKAHVPEMQAKLADTAARAATSYMAAKDYEQAYQAVHLAEALGSTSASNKAVRSVLESTASDLYREAGSERTTDPDDARKKLRQIQGIVDTGNPLRARAQKLLNEL